VCVITWFAIVAAGRLIRVFFLLLCGTTVVRSTIQEQLRLVQEAVPSGFVTVCTECLLTGAWRCAAIADIPATKLHFDEMEEFV
jgi:hypothetical protein